MNARILALLLLVILPVVSILVWVGAILTVPLVVFFFGGVGDGIPTLLGGLFGDLYSCGGGVLRRLRAGSSPEWVLALEALTRGRGQDGEKGGEPDP